MALPLSVSMMNKIMRRKWSALNCRAKKMYETVKIQVNFLTSQYIGTCKSAYTKGYALN